MSFAVDVNILLYASASESPEHGKAVAFLSQCAAGPELCCFAWVTLMSYLRMATHPAILKRPLSHAEAAANVESLLSLPHVRAIGEDETYWATYRSVVKDAPVRGNLVPDAQLATILRCHGIKTLYTHDRDFRKFAHLEVRDPVR